MADLNDWDSEYKELVIEHLYRLNKDELVDALVGYMSNNDVEDLIDMIELIKRRQT